MTISVIIPTYNGAHRISGLLRSLERQTTPPDEVVVVVDGSQDGTAELLRSQSWDLGKLRIIEQVNGGRAQVRNRGAAEATGELLIFLDDDQIAAPELVEAHLRHHRDHPDSIATGWLEPLNRNPKEDIERFKIWLHRKWTQGWQPSSPSSQPLSTPYLAAANLSLSCGLFSQLEGFDPRLRDAEDYDLAIRAKIQGVACYLVARGLSYNTSLEQTTFTTYLMRQRQYAVAHSSRRALRGEKSPSISPKNWKSMAFRLFQSSWWPRSVDSGCWRWLPAKVRYKLYDIILTAQLRIDS